MPNLARISCTWANWPGAPGVSQFYADPSTLQPVVNALAVFWTAMQGAVPANTTVQVASSGDLVNDEDGKITGAWSVPDTPARMTGNGAGAYAGNAGAVMHWLTVGLAKGRRIRGRTFIVPCVQTVYDDGGTLSNIMVVQSELAGNKLIADCGGALKVWHRPTWVTPKTKPPVLESPGTQATITSCRMPDLAVSLRSRR